MNSSEKKSSEINSQLSFPYKIFISHKVSEHGDAVKKFKKILDKNDALKDKLKIYVSSDVAAGDNWRENLHKELDETNLLIYIYCFNTPPAINDWCNYEIGYFAKKSNRTNIITIVPSGVGPPPLLRPYQYVELTNGGIEKLLKRVYVEENIWPEVIWDENAVEKSEIVEKIINNFSPTKKPIPLSPRIWITVQKDSECFLKKEFPEISMDSKITGETDAAKKFGYESGDNEEITLKELIEKVEFRGTLPKFFDVLASTLKDIVNKKAGPKRVPPVRVLNDKPPSMLIPAYLHELPNGDKKFEFVVTEPPINIAYRNENLDAMDLYNLFTVAWHFRWRVIEKHLENIKRILSAGVDRYREIALQHLSELKIDLSAVILDSFNRKLQFPGDITKHFTGKDKVVIEKIVNSKNGLWMNLMPKFDNAVDKVDLDQIVECLEEMQSINKTCIVLCLKLLEKVVSEKLEGEILNNMDQTKCIMRDHPNQQSY
jgi:hypothetical protein